MRSRTEKKKRARVVDEIYGITKVEKEIRENAPDLISDFCLLQIGAERNKRPTRIYVEYLMNI